MAFAFWFCAKVSEAHAIAEEVCVGVQTALLKPAPPTVPSFAKPGPFNGAEKPTLLMLTPPWASRP